MKNSLHGQLLRVSDNGYNDARKIWNAMIDKHPALILRCTGTAGIGSRLLKQITIGIFLLFFFSSSFASLEQLSARLDADPQTSLWTLDHDYSSENAVGRRTLKRSHKGKFSLKSLPAIDKPTRATHLVVRIRKTALIPRFSNPTIYQQINVYRI